MSPDRERHPVLPFSCYVFDAVGTVLYPHPPAAEIYSTLGRRYGSRRTVEEVSRRFSAVFAELEQQDLAGDLRTSEEREQERWRQIVRRVLEDTVDPEACFRELYAYFGEGRAWRVYEDVWGVLAVLRQFGKRIVLASNFDHRLHQVLRDLGLDPCLDAVVISASVGFRKPHPAFFYAVLDACSCEASCVLYVGDSRENDYEGAVRCGIPAVLLDRSGRQLDGPRQISSLWDLLDGLGLALPHQTRGL
jgi:putative hydrolase of the HAD superfamily